MADEDEITRRLVESEDELRRFLARHAGPRLLRFESAEDLVQAVHVEAVKAAASFEYRSQPEFFAWLYRIARRTLYDRNAHWYARKRRAPGLIRLAVEETGAFESLPGVDPADPGASPSSFASRREQVVLVARALETLLPRDQEILRLSSDGHSIEDIATRLEIGYDAAERARLRALERLKKATRILIARLEGET